MTDRRLHLPRGSLAEPPYDLALTPEQAGWTSAGLSVLTLRPGETVRLDAEGAEILVLSLSGSCTVGRAGRTHRVEGRTDVFAGPSDFVYVPVDSTVDVTSEGGGRFALPSALCDRTLEFRHQPASAVPVELRGAGQASRQVNNFCTPDAFEAIALIACEVLTPGGNWSSYPPHKHDEDQEGESALEEIYYYEVADGPAGPGVGYQRVYGHHAARIDLLAEVRTGDVVLVPYGWHGPSMAAPGYDLYYLNVMAGSSDERAWLISDDPAHGWVRDTWVDQDVDARLPFGSGGAR